MPRVEATIAKARADGFDDIVIGYGDCGTGGKLERLAEREGVEMLPGAHCYAFFAGIETFEAYDEIDAFYLTDFLARHFDAFVVKPLKLREHPELIEMMFAHYGRVVHLVQDPAEVTSAAARRAADMLGLPLEVRQTGYGDLRSALSDATSR